jgi:hypothetical protein
MRRRLLLALSIGLALATAQPGLGVSPGPDTRKGLLPLGVCEGGPLEGQHCLDDFDCSDGPGRGRGHRATCSTPLGKHALRGVLTLIADKDSGGWDDTSFVSEEPDALGTPIPTDLTKSTLTVMLEFKRRGRTVVLTETYKDLGDFVDPALRIDCRGFCVPTWREPAVEARIASPGTGGGSGAGGGGGGGAGGGTGGGGGQAAGGEGIRIQFGTGGTPLEQALLRALELPAGTVPYLEVVEDDEIFDHSEEDDVLASVRRIDVVIRFILPDEGP